MTTLTVRTSLVRALVLAALVVTADIARAADSSLEDWAVYPGFSLAIDSLGFNLPTAIAFVPEPGPGPDDPLYFVTELRGEIKVVTNSRSVLTFATVPTDRTQKDDLRGASQQGLAGICLDPGRGYVFVTFTYRDKGGVLRNDIVRFTTRPRTFGLAPEETRDFREILAHFQSAPAHQIGGCQVRGEALFVGVGDGGNVSASRNPSLLLGKVLCLTLDGRPCRDNPFPRVHGHADRTAAYVWAYGLRNPFGVAIVGDDIFVAENGIKIDRFLRVRRGADHHWDGSDQSLTPDALLVFLPPAAGPVQVAALRAAPPFVPAGFADHFFVAMFGLPRGVPGVVAFGYDFRAARVRNVPKHVLAYHGKRPQGVIGVAVGPDGLYVVPGFPDASGRSGILRMYHQPGKEHSVIIGTASDPTVDPRTALLTKHSCTNCHLVQGGDGGGIAPSLDRFGLTWRLTERLNSRAYEESLARTDLRHDEPFVAFRDARRKVLEAKGTERTRVWLKYFLLEPRFDNPKAAMPNPGLTEAQAKALGKALHFAPPRAVSASNILDSIGGNWRAVAFGFSGGAGVSALLTVVLVSVSARRRRRRA